MDVIAGTSAGGINGVCLAKALAHNLSLDGFRDLWFERGDIDGLLAAPRWLPTRALKGAWVALRALKHAPLRGDLMARWIYDAFHQMDEKGSTPETLVTLMPQTAPARAVRDRHRLLRLRPAGAVRRPEPDPRHAAPTPARRSATAARTAATTSASTRTAP